jgi:malate synthase
LSDGIVFRKGVLPSFGDVLGPGVLAALAAVGTLDEDRRRLMSARLSRRAARARDRQPFAFQAPGDLIPRTQITVAAARAGEFDGSPIPPDLERQWIQGTGPATRPRASTDAGLRSVAYALLSGADGWMFDGEDALGQLQTMSFENQRNLKLALAGDTVFLRVAEPVAAEMNGWSQRFLGRRIVTDWQQQLHFTTRIFRPRGLHLDDRNIRHADGAGFSASIADTVIYVVNNAATLRGEGRSIVLYLPKIQTAEEAALWNEILGALEVQAGLASATIRTYVLVEQLEASFALMEIRAALGARFVGFNTGRWDYINSVADAMAWDETFVCPNIDAMTMTYAFMQAYEDRVRRAVNTKDRGGRYALWQGGMEPNIPVGSEAGVKDGMRRAVGGAEREQTAGASGKWVAHWKMVQIVRPVWERAGQPNQLGRPFAPLEYTEDAARRLTALTPAPRTVRGVRDLLSVGLQYGNAFGRGFQAAALKPADFFGDDDVLYLMEDAATGEIRLSILWEWLHKKGTFTEDDPETGVRSGDPMTETLLARLTGEEYAKLRTASDRDVHDDSKETTLPIARAIVDAYVRSPVKPPWYIDLLNLNLENDDLSLARERIERYLLAMKERGVRSTENVDFETSP